MLNFKPITLEARRDLLPFLGKEHHSACYQSFATMYLWSGIYQTRYCLTGEWLFTKSGREDGYGFPYGDGDLKEGITLLRQDAEENGKELWFFGLLPTEKAWLEANYPGEFTYTASRDDAEYIYEADKLMTYAGKKLHGKRNFCNRFEAAHPDWRFEPITAENREDVLLFHRQWQTANEGEDEGLHKERVEPEQRNKKILDGVRAIAFRDLSDILKDLDRDLVKGAFAGEHFAENFFPACKDEKLAATVKELMA
mgnify:CR=1 FL=1